MSTQISFSIRVSSGVKAVHVVGSWDGYRNQLPLSRDKASTSGKSWRGEFRFGATSVVPGERYWYYFIVDGYHCAVNPSIDSTVEPTTGRELNILDVPTEKSSSSKPKSSSSSSSKHSSSSSKHSSSKHSSSKHSSSSSSKDKDRKSRRLSIDIAKVEVAKGRPLSVSDIKSPKPITPLATRHVLRYEEDEIDALAAQFGGTVMIDDEGVVSAIHMGSPSPASSSAGSSYYRSDTSSPCSSNGSSSGYSTPSSDYGVCTCDNYGITRRGDRIKIDCGGRVCGYSDDEDSSDCASEAASPVRRRGVVFH